MTIEELRMTIEESIKTIEDYIEYTKSQKKFYDDPGVMFCEGKISAYKDALQILKEII